MLGTYSYRVRAIKDNFYSTYTNEVLYVFNSYSAPTDGLIAYYPFNGNADDESGNGNDGTVYGPTLTIDRFGHSNTAYSFDGTDDYIDIGNKVKPNFPITVSSWIKVNNYSHIGSIFRNDLVNSSAYRYGLMLAYNNGVLTIAVYEGFSAPDNRRNTFSEDDVVTPGVWHNFTAVFHSHTDMESFLDGIQLAITSEGSGSSMKYSTNNGGIGNRSGGYYFNGLLDDIRVYNRALSEDEILLLYKENSQ